jgi:putative acetyltransferase
VQVANVSAGGDLLIVRRLFEEYWSSFGFPSDFQGFESEVSSLPGEYDPPGGRLGLAWIDGEPAGCVALRRLDFTCCEAKRLYVRPAYRGRGIGRALLEWLISEARKTGYSEMVADTMPAMNEALAMYERMGFERSWPYAERPTPGAIYLRLSL